MNGEQDDDTITTHQVTPPQIATELLTNVMTPEQIKVKEKSQY